VVVVTKLQSRVYEISISISRFSSLSRRGRKREKVRHTFSPEFPIIEGFVSFKMKVTVGTNTSNKRGKSRSF